MKPAPFDYHRPASVAEAVELLGSAEEAKVLAGGQSLVPLLNMRLAQPTDLVDLDGIDGLDRITLEQGSLRIGSMVRQARAERSQEVADGAPLLAAALREIAHPQIRSRGTVGGSIAHADPAAELPAALLALEGEVVAEGRAGRRTISADDFFAGFLTTALESDEILVEVVIPTRDADAAWGCVEVARRSGDYALAGAMTVMRIEGESITSGRIVVFSIADVPVRAPAAERELVGATPDPDLWRRAGVAAAQGLDPGSDLQSSAAYRKHVTAVVVQRALEQAATRGA